jgi:hypothetical protein
VDDYDAEMRAGYNAETNAGGMCHPFTCDFSAEIIRLRISAFARKSDTNEGRIRDPV